MRDLSGDFRDRGHPAAGWMLFQTKWTECLHGAGSLRETLSDLADLTDARVALLSRTCEMTGRARVIASLDRGARSGERPATVPLAPSLLAVSARQPRPGTLWTLADLDRSDREALDARALRWMADRRLRDAAVVPLDKTGTEADTLELHFTAPVSRPLHVSLEMAAVAASAAWRRRQKGRIARILSAAPAVADRLSLEIPAHRQSPLSAANPLRLTAAELRICILFRNGHPPQDMARHLKISDSTLRTHLRSIYAKAGVTGQVALVRLLIAVETDGESRRAG
jgi:DNA-binding CsgD family transcriptional regulator